LRARFKRAARIAGFVILSVVALALALVMILAFNGRLAAQVVEYAVERAAGGNFALSVRTVRGNRYGRLVAENVSIAISRGKVERISAEEVALGYDLLGLLRGKPGVIEIEAERPKVFLARGRGTAAAVRYAAGKETGRGGTTLVEVKLNDGEVVGASGKTIVKDVVLTGDVLIGPDSTAVVVRDAGLTTLGGIEFSEMRCKLEYAGERLKLTRLEAEVAGSSLRLQGEISPGERDLVAMRAKLSSVRLDSLLRVLGVEPSLPRTTFDAELTFRGNPEGLTGTLAARGEYAGTAFHLVARQFNLRGAHVSALANLDLGKSRIGARLLMNLGTEGDVSVESRFEHLDPALLFPGFDRLESLGGSDLTGEATVAKGFRPGSPVEIRGSLGASTLGEVEIAGAVFGGSYRPGPRMSIDSLALWNKSSFLSAVGEWGDTVSILGEVEVEDLSSVGLGRRFAPLSGRMQISFGLNGRGDSLFVDAEGSLEKLARSGFRLDRAYVRVRAGRILPSAAVEAELTCENGAWKKVSVDSIAGSVRLSGREVRGSLLAVRGGDRMQARGRVELGEGRFRAILDRLDFNLGGDRWNSTKSSVVEWVKDSLGVVDLDMSSETGGELHLEGRLLRAPHVLEASGILRGFRLESVAALVGEGGRLGGRADGSFMVRADSSRESGRLELKLSETTLGKFALGEVSGSLDLESDSLKLDRLEAKGHWGSLSLSGWCRPEGQAKLLSPEGARGLLANGILGVEGRLSGVDLAILSEGLSAKNRLEGSLAGSISVLGSTASPRAKFRLRGRNVKTYLAELDSVSLAGRFTQGRLDADSIVLRHAGGMVSGAAALPLRIGPRGKVGLLPNGPMEIRLAFRNTDLSFLPKVIPWLAEFSGAANGRVTVAGTPRERSLSGGIRLTGARARIAGRGETIDELSGRLDFDGARIRAVLDGRQRPKGAVKIDVTYDTQAPAESLYAVHVKLDNFSFMLPESYSVTLSGDARVSPFRGAEVALPEVHGNLLMTRGVYLKSFSAGSGPPEPPGWIGEVVLEIPRNFWIKNMGAEIELSGKLYVKQSYPEGLNLLGTLKMLNGKYYLFDNQFRIERGELQFNNVREIDPAVDIVAHTVASNEEITLTLTGKLSEPHIELSSAGGYAEADIIELLTIGKLRTKESTEEQSTLDVPLPAMGNYLLRHLERRLAARLQWVDSVELGSSSGSTGRPYLGLGKYLTRGLFLRFEQGLSVPNERSLYMEYRLSDLFRLRGGVVRYGSSGGVFEDVYSLDLRIRYEY